ncbi:MAG TPA: hypothetical protein VJN22_04755 [Candidatus Eremiobacteraceae bacterium]|nr:hypothetical protein [Candidatus Eremiobacteraceae bacterium]
MFNRFLRCLLVSGVVMSLPVAATAYPALYQSACAWHVVTSPNPFAEGNDLFSVSAVSATDAWAVGYYTASGNLQPLFEHWNGTKWSVVAGPNPGYSFLDGVTALATNDVWAVGAVYDSAHAVYQNLTEHWDGSSWSVVSVPSLGFVNNFLYGVSGTSGNDVWIVGAYNISSSVRGTVIGHRNMPTGSWVLAAGPDKGSGTNVLGSVAAIKPNDAWAVGIYTSGSVPQTLAEHWNGTKWKIVATPDANALNNLLNSTSAVNAHDVWAVGDYYNGTIFQTLAEHFNGTSWSLVPSPNMGSSAVDLFGSAAVTTHDVWAVGQQQSGTYTKTFTMNWNGTAWSAVTSPNPSLNDNFLNGAAKIPGTSDIWAVGGITNADHSYHHTLIEKFHC